MPHAYEKEWKPFCPTEIAAVFQGAPFLWWIAGGHAIEHFVGRQFRSHADIDILALRKDAAALRSYLLDWDCWVVDPPGQLSSWRVGQALGADIHDVWCRQNRRSPWAFQVMFDENDGLQWHSRRCSQVSKPLQNLGISNDRGMLFLAPEVQLFYKAKCPRTKDNLDFEAALSLLAPEQRTWLIQAIDRAYGPANIWSARLRAL